MKKARLIKRNQIMVLYQYFLLGENDRQFANFLRLNTFSRTNIESSIVDQQSFTWFDDFKRKKRKIFTLIDSNLKSSWKIERLPVFEKSIIASAVYTIEKQAIVERKQIALLVNQTMNFSKKYLEKEKCGYINKLLDLVAQTCMKKQVANCQARQLDNLTV